MRTWLLTVVLGSALVGCAHQEPKHAFKIHNYDEEDRQAAVSSPKAAASPDDGSVRIVAHKPSSRQYKFVGRVAAAAGSGDLVAVANAADADLKRQAAALGATIVQIDVVAPPAEHAHPGRIVLAGRAYKEIHGTNVARR